MNPQIMHHYEPSRELGYVSPVDAGSGDGEAASEEAFESVKGKMFNIVESARYKALFGARRRAHVRQTSRCID